eukprot:SAG11_NODE_38382_length_256_cov_1.248366_1_plen_27_part_10
MYLPRRFSTKFSIASSVASVKLLDLVF